MRVWAAMALALAQASPSAAASAPLPAFTPGGPVRIGHVIDGDRLALADGRVLRLAGIETPTAAMRSQADLAARAAAFLARRVAGASLTIAYAGAPVDRNGDVVAALFANGHWVERALVRAGFARVHGAADERIGLRKLMAVEATARAARRGIWRRRFFAVRQPWQAARWSESFQIVQGTVFSVDRVGSGYYVNFGRDWRHDFALRIEGRALALCRAQGLDPPRLVGARLRVRGYIDGVVRPLITILYPEEIEHLDAGTGAAAAAD